MIRLSRPKTQPMCGVGTLIHDSPEAVDLKVPFCDRWGCDACGPRRRARCEIQARRGRPTKFLTLTCKRGDGGTPTDRRKRMGKAFPLLIRRMQRHLGTRIPYFVVVEATQNGEPHFHVLLRCGFILNDLISKWWRELTGWHITKTKAVDDGRKAANYIHKYIGKAPHKFGHCKRYWMSRDWELPPEEGERVKQWEPRVWRWTIERIDEVEWSYLRQRYWRVPGEVEPGVRRMMWPLWGTGPPPGQPGEVR